MDGTSPTNKEPMIVDDPIENEERSRIANWSVAEKVVICIDRHLLSIQSKTRILTLLRGFRKRKESIAVQPVEFYYLFFGNEAHMLKIESENELERVLNANILQDDESQSFDVELIFKTLAMVFQLPDPNVFNDLKGPPYVLHAVLLFGRNEFLPKLTEKNCFLFFASNPFFELDILYLHGKNPEKKIAKISKALKTVKEFSSGYYHEIELSKYHEITSILNEFLGHPLIRYPQDTARFKIDIRENESVY